MIKQFLKVCATSFYLTARLLLLFILLYYLLHIRQHFYYFIALRDFDLPRIFYLVLLVGALLQNGVQVFAKLAELALVLFGYLYGELGSYVLLHQAQATIT